MQRRNDEMRKPKKYNMEDREDVRRWFSEMESYFRVEDFVHRGTDLEGRKFALDGFNQLKMRLTTEM